MQPKQAVHANQLRLNHMTDPVVISQLPVKQTLIPPRETKAAAKQRGAFHTLAGESCDR